MLKIITITILVATFNCVAISYQADTQPINPIYQTLNFAKLALSPIPKNGCHYRIRSIHENSKASDIKVTFSAGGKKHYFLSSHANGSSFVADCIQTADVKLINYQL